MGTVRSDGSQRHRPHRSWGFGGDCHCRVEAGDEDRERLCHLRQLWPSLPGSHFARREEHLPVFPGTFIKYPSARSEVYTVEIRIQRKVGDAANFPKVTGNRGHLDGQVCGGGKKKGKKTRAPLRWPTTQLNILHGEDEMKGMKVEGITEDICPALKSETFSV